MSHKTFKISGVPVLFPGKPYPSQFSMMDRIIKGIERRQHCLLESPTGSGKSLALLCSSLAWLTEEKAKKDQENQAEFDKGVCICCCHVDGVTTNGDSSHTTSETSPYFQKEESITIEDNDEDEFKKDAVNFNTKSSDKKNVRKHISIAYETDENKSTIGSEKPGCQKCTCSSSTPVHRKIPKIFFGTRTHKQVSQIVRELNKTEYRDINMTILGSREHTCIHPTVSKSKSKNEGCKELLNGPGCPLKDKVQRYLSHQVIKGQGLSSAWDLEDLIGLCKPKRICPYFLSRGLKEDADLIICPYNYLVDPLIREAMSLSLKGHIVILDEAHNIEDSSREAASQTIAQDTITAAIKDIETLMQNHNLADYSRLIHVLSKLDNFIEENKNSLEKKEYNQSYKIWNGFHIVAQLDGIGMGPKHFPDLKKALAKIKTDAEERKEELTKNGLPGDEEMKPATLNVLEQLFMVMDFLYRHDLKYVDDYRTSLVHSINYVPRHEENQWLNSRGRNGGRKMVQVDLINLNFWCMNPAVAFSDFAETRSVILTSGTLSPMTSFQSELGLEFKIQLEANHVIKDSQVWVGSLGQGPNGTSLMAVYRNLESLAFQDELGQVVLRVCKTVPHGVLCFLPSYKVLDKLYTRWENTGLLDRIGERKKILREPRGSNKEDFEEQIVNYYRAVQSTNDPEDSTDGAIMLAVCRGKISEGLDFADDYARAVISVGIPYPNFKDIQVELKRKYNDQHRHDRGLMSGSDWYDIQAFRALNQALGRCIRHKNDWGALIIIDERFVRSAPKYTKGLSKWVRNKVCPFDNYTCGMDSLNEFILQRKKVEKEQNLDSSMSCESSTLIPVTPKAFYPNTSINSTGNTSNNAIVIDEGSKLQESKSDASLNNSPSYKHFSIFNMGKPNVTPIAASAKERNPRNNGRRERLASVSPRPATTTTATSTSHHLPTAVVHPSFVVPPKPLTSISNISNKPVIGNNHTSDSSSIVPNHNAENHNHQHRSVATASNSGPDDSNTKSLTNNSRVIFPVKQLIQIGESKICLRIITEKAQPGTRMKVFDIHPSLHDVFGGNLNLPVSTTERLVYLVDPPSTPGGNPLARIIKMSEEEKEKIALAQQVEEQQQKQQQQQQQQQQQPEKDVSSVENLKTMSSDKSLEKAITGSSLPPEDNTLKSDCQNKSSTNVKDGNANIEESNFNKASNVRICNTASSPNSYKMSTVNEGTQNCEEEPNSSCSLFDSPTVVSKRDEPQQSVKNASEIITSHNDLGSGTNTTTSDSTNLKSNKKNGNPLLKFLPSKSDANAVTRDVRQDTIDNSSSSTSPISPDMFQSKMEPVAENKDSNTKDFKSRKPLFKVGNKNIDTDNKEKSNSLPQSIQKLDVKCNSENIDGKQIKTNNVRRSASKTLMSSEIVNVESSSLDFEEKKERDISKMKDKEEENISKQKTRTKRLTSETKKREEEEEIVTIQEEEEEVNLNVKRKCGRKRRSLSLKGQEKDSKKSKSGNNQQSPS